MPPPSFYAQLNPQLAV